MRELTFEHVRAQQFADKPTRFSTSFGCLTEADARSYQAKNDPPRITILHRVELADPTLAAHIGPIAMLDWPPPNSSFLDVTKAQATSYWSGQDIGPMEVISLSALRVVANID